MCKMEVGLLVVLFICAIHGKKYFDENFEDDSWFERWVTPDPRDGGSHRPTDSLRTTERYYGTRNSTGLRVSAEDAPFLLAARFPQFAGENKTLVLQFSVTYAESRSHCNYGYIKLFNCAFNPATLNRDTQFYLMFGPNSCENPAKLYITFNYESKYYGINRTFDTIGTTLFGKDPIKHVYTLTVYPNQTYQVLVDGKQVHSGILLDDLGIPQSKQLKNETVPKLIYWDNASEIDDPKITNPKYKDPIIQPTVDNPMYSIENEVLILPSICGIGFQFWQEETGGIFDDILVTENVSVANDRRKLIMNDMVEEKIQHGLGAELEDYYRHRNFQDSWMESTRFVVVIDSKMLQNILGTKHKIQYKNDKKNRTETFLTVFKTFIVSFDWDNTSVFKVVAEYNKNQFQNISCNTCIKLWVSFQPRDDISDDVDAVINAIMEAESIFPGTVQFVIINYGFLLIDRQSQAFVSHEIRKVYTKLSALLLPLYQLPMLGIQLDTMNCRNEGEYFEDLELDSIRIVLLVSPEKHFLTKYNMSTAGSWNLCKTWISILRKKKVTNFSVHKQLSVEINLEKGMYTHNRHWPIDHSHEYLLIQAEFDNNTVKKNIGIERNKMTRALVNWLHRPTEFSIHHFGAVISTEENMPGLKQLASKFFAGFRKSFIQLSPQNHSSNDVNLNEIVLKLIDYSFSVHKTNILDGHSNQFTEGTPLQLSIYVGIDTMDFDTWKIQLDKAVSAAVAGNIRLPGTLNTIVVDWLACWSSKNCSGFTKTHWVEDSVFTEMCQNVFNVHNYANSALTKLGSNNTITVAVAIDNYFLSSILETVGKKMCLENEINPFKHITVFVCKAIVKQTDILQNGAFKTFDTLKLDLALCERTTRAFQLTVYIFVNVIGCASDRSNMTHLIEYALFFEKLSKWAVTDNKTLFTNAGTEDQLKCGQNNVSMPAECTCGWWINTNTKSNFGATFEDKKSIALHIYQAKANASSRNSKELVPLSPAQILSWILAVTIPFLLIGTTLTAILVLWYRSKYILTKQEVMEFVKGRKSTRAQSGDGRTDEDKAAENQSYNSDKYELNPSSFTIDITSTGLGSGEFGHVYRGSIERDGSVIQVAVKVANRRTFVKSDGYYLALKGLLSEIKILSYLGQHNHVVSLLGAYTKNVRKGEIAVFLELCQLGSMDKYLRSIKPQIRKLQDDEVSPRTEMQDTSSAYVDCDAIYIQCLDQESSDNLYRWAGEIATGMEFLVSKKLIHGDLATRNILLTSEKVAKIADFGLSRRLYDYTEYVKRSQAPLPWRWMAPESLRRMFFDEKTDIWAFGITLWEMFTLGDEPYPGLSWTPDFPALLEGGVRLNEPRFNVKQIYSTMQQCWHIDPEFRPSFAELKSEFNAPDNVV